jgi:hypothetical protein
LQATAAIEHRDVAKPASARFGKCSRRFRRWCGIRKSCSQRLIALQDRRQIGGDFLRAPVAEGRRLRHRMHAVEPHLDRARRCKAAGDQQQGNDHDDADMTRARARGCLHGSGKGIDWPSEGSALRHERGAPLG